MLIPMLDFCVSFIGENTGLLSRSCFSTLKLRCDLSGVTFHLVNKHVSSKVWADVIESVKKLDRPFNTYDLDTGWNPYSGVVDAFAFDGLNAPTFNDAARTAEWTVDNCGSAEWCILSHFDVVWNGDILGWLKEKQESSGSMMVGAHCPIMLLNRPAYRRCGVSFESTHTDDVGVVLGRALNSYGFVSHQDMAGYFSHLGGGGSYHTYEEFRFMRERAIANNRKQEYGALITPEVFHDGSGRWVTHLDSLDSTARPLCGSSNNVMRTNDIRAANCDKCLSLAGVKGGYFGR